MPDLIIREEVEALLPPGLEERMAPLLDALVEALGASAQAECSVVLTDDEEVQELNLQWRGEDKTTDVLSFAYQEAEDSFVAPQLLGDVVVSVPTAARQASSAEHQRRLAEGNAVAEQWSLEEEILFLIVHGFLHLVGHDHAEPDEEAEMKAKERELWALLSARRS